MQQLHLFPICKKLPSLPVSSCKPPQTAPPPTLSPDKHQLSYKYTYRALQEAIKGFSIFKPVKLDFHRLFLSSFTSFPAWQQKENSPLLRPVQVKPTRSVSNLKFSQPHNGLILSVSLTENGYTNENRTIYSSIYGIKGMLIVLNHFPEKKRKKDTEVGDALRNLLSVHYLWTSDSAIYAGTRRKEKGEAGGMETMSMMLLARGRLDERKSVIREWIFLFCSSTFTR